MLSGLPDTLLSANTKLVFYGIVVTAYMAMAYDVVKDLFEKPYDWTTVWHTLVAGILSLGVGIAVFVFLIYKKKL